MARRGRTGSEEFCSFCYKPGNEAGRLLAGPAGIHICEECVKLCSDIIGSDNFAGGKPSGARKAAAGAKAPTPREIHRRLDEYVIGHDGTKRALSVAVFNHYQRVNAKSAGLRGVELEKSNILLLGETGTGKTLLARTLARIVDVPFAMADATTLTEAGYVGEDVENILLKLIQAADGDIPRAQKGIVFIDEIDKIQRKSENRSITRDVSGEGVQQALLKILEGTVANVPPQGGRKHPEQQYLKVDTTDILFVCGGSFEGLEQVIGRRVGRAQIGFHQRAEAAVESRARDALLLKQVEPDDLVKFGMIPELVGRLPVLCPLDHLDKEAYFRVLREPKNAILRQFAASYGMLGVELDFDRPFLDLVVDEAYEKKLGVRALRSILEKYMIPLTYEVASMDAKPAKMTVTKDLAERGASGFLAAIPPSPRPAPVRLNEVG